MRHQRGEGLLQGDAEGSAGGIAQQFVSGVKGREGGLVHGAEVQEVGAGVYDFILRHPGGKIHGSLEGGEDDEPAGGAVAGGTVISVAGALAGMASMLTLGKSNRSEKVPNVIMASMLAVIVSPSETVIHSRRVQLASRKRQ